MNASIPRRAGFALCALLLLPGGLAAQEADYPTEPPPPLEPRRVDFPAVGRDTLENGLELVVVENHEQPVVSVRLYTPAGEAAEPDGKIGVAGLTASTLDKGTESRSAEEIASSVEGAGGSLTTGASDDFGYVATSVLTERLPTVLDVFADVVRNPTFPEDEVANQKKRTKSGLQSQLSNPNALASRRFRSLIYGSHPYGEDPRPDDIDGIRRGDLVSFHESRYTPDGSLLVFAGDITLDRAREVARSRFGDWTGPAVANADLPEPPGADSLRIHLVHRPASSQSSIWVGHLGPGRNAGGHHALDVLNQVLGAGPASRLFLVLREEKGWTYGARSRFTEPRDRGYFAVSADVRPAVTDSTLTEMLHQLRRIRSEPVPEEELVDAKSYLTGHFPLQLETPQQVASQVADALLRDRGIGYLESYRSEVSRVTAAEVQQAAREHVRPDHATVVVVGDARKIHDELEAIAPVTLWNTDFEGMEPAELEVSRSGVALQASRVREGDFGYSFRVQGKPLGEMSMTVEPAGDGRLRVRQELTGQISQSSSYVVTSDLSPVSVTSEATMGPLSLGQDLSYDGARVTGKATVPDRSGDGGGGRPSTRQVSVDTTLAEGTLDGNTNLAVALGSPLAQGFEMQVPVFSPGQGVNSLNVRVTGRETVEVPAGSFETWTVDLEGPEQTATIYVTREAPHLMVKQEVAGQPVTVVLTDTGP